MFILFHHVFWLRYIIKANIDKGIHKGYYRLTKTNQNYLFFTVDSVLKQCCQSTVDMSTLKQRWNNVVNQLLICQRWNNDEIMLSINRWCINVESTMMQRWRCNLTIYQHINVDSTSFQLTAPAGEYMCEILMKL